MANIMYTRGLTTTINLPDGTLKEVVMTSNLRTLESETVTNINDLIDHTNNLHRRMNAVEELIKFAGWVKELYPHLVKDYATSESVAARLTDDTLAVQNNKE